MQWEAVGGGTLFFECLKSQEQFLVMFSGHEGYPYVNDIMGQMIISDSDSFLILYGEY